MTPIIAAGSKLGPVISLAMVVLGVSALSVRLAVPSVSARTIVLFRRMTDVLVVAYLLVTFPFFMALIWIIVDIRAESRQKRNVGRDLLFVLGIGLLVLGALGVLDAMGIVYLRAVVLIPAAFLILIGFAWSGFVESKKDYAIQEQKAASAPSRT